MSDASPHRQVRRRLSWSSRALAYLKASPG
jgi:hypothetical protein